MLINKLRIFATLIFGIIFIAQFDIARAEKSMINRPASMMELIELLDDKEAAFAMCLGSGQSLQDLCWEHGREGGSQNYGFSGVIIFYANNTGKIQSRGYEETFAWNEKDGIIFQISKANPFKYKLSEGIYIISENPQEGTSVLLNEDAQSLIKRFKSKN